MVMVSCSIIFLANITLLFISSLIAVAVPSVVQRPPPAPAPEANTVLTKEQLFLQAGMSLS